MYVCMDLYTHYLFTDEGMCDVTDRYAQSAHETNGTRLCLTLHYHHLLHRDTHSYTVLPQQQLCIGALILWKNTKS